uniref:Retrotransposon gag domain-containing protein n=1 Tax=Cajanus cajan TaxID=3821 RepID=A0A151UGU0_CAJCA
MPRHDSSSLIEPRVDLPPFHGKDNVHDYLDWEIKVEQLFTCHNVSEEKRVPMATLSFQGSAMHWWTSLMKEKKIIREPSIKYWNELRSALRMMEKVAGVNVVLLLFFTKAWIYFKELGTKWIEGNNGV